MELLKQFNNTPFLPYKSTKEWKKEELERVEKEKDKEEGVRRLCRIAELMASDITDYESFKEWRNVYFTPIFKKEE